MYPKQFRGNFCYSLEQSMWPAVRAASILVLGHKIWLYEEEIRRILLGYNYHLLRRVSKVLVALQYISREVFKVEALFYRDVVRACSSRPVTNAQPKNNSNLHYLARVIIHSMSYKQTLNDNWPTICWPIFPEENAHSLFNVDELIWRRARELYLLLKLTGGSAWIEITYLVQVWPQSTWFTLITVSLLEKYYIECHRRIPWSDAWDIR